MKFRTILPAAAVGLALSLAACGQGEEATADDTEATEVAPEGEAAEAAEPAAYTEDLTGGRIDAAVLAELNGKLTEFHGSSGKSVFVITTLTTEGRDIDEVANEMRAERNADALILVAGQDQALAIVGEGIDGTVIDETEAAMIARFEENDLAGGLNLGADAVIAQLGGGAPAAE